MIRVTAKFAGRIVETAHNATPAPTASSRPYSATRGRNHRVGLPANPFCES